MHVVRRILSDVRRGRELDLYAAVAVSLAVAVLALLGVDNERLTLALLLAVLALLGVSLLVLRDQNRSLSLSVRQLAAGTPQRASQFFASEDQFAEIVKAVRTSSSAWFWGTTLQTHLPYFEESMRSGLSRGNSYRVLLIKPHSSAVLMAAFRARGMSAREFDEHLEGNLTRLRRVSRVRPGMLDLRGMDYLNPYVLYIFDHGMPSARLYVRLATFHGSDEQRGEFWVSAASDPEWYAKFSSEYKAAWAAADDLLGEAI